MNVIRALLFALACACAFSTASSQEAVQARADFGDVEARFNGGRWEFENMGGAYFLFDRGGNERVTIDYALYSARLGFMLYDPAFTGILRGNVELLAEAFGGPIFNGPGNAAAGATLFIRYNFVQPGARIVPYIQGGGGLVYADIAQGAASSNAVSQDVNLISRRSPAFAST